MNLPESLVDDMMRLPPEQIRWLSKSELEASGLWGEDPVYKEAHQLNLARSYGLARGEFMRRQQRMTRGCGDLPSPFLSGCREDIFWGGGNRPKP